jgi:hypothetical protein
VCTTDIDNNIFLSQFYVINKPTLIMDHPSISERFARDGSEESLDFLRESNRIDGIFNEEADAVALKAFLNLPNPLTLEGICAAHMAISSLPDGTMCIADHCTPGKIRNYGLMIGDTPALAHRRVGPELKKWMSSANRRKRTLPAIVVSHLDFVTMRPYGDADGRLGRMLYLWECVKNGVEPHVFRSEDSFDEYHHLFLLRDLNLI